MYDTLRFWTMSAADFLDEYFESEIVKAHFAGSSIIGTALGPRSPGTAYVLAASLHGRYRRHRRRLGFRARRHGRGHPGARRVVPGQRRRDSQRGAASRKSWCATDAPPASRWPTARRFTRQLVISNLDVRRTFLETMDAKDLPAGVRAAGEEFQDPRLFRKVEHRARTACREFPAIPPGFTLHARRHARHRHHRDDGTRLRRLEGRHAGRRAPYIDMLIPSQIDPTMVPDGKHYMSVFVQYCPYELADGPWDAAKRKAFGDTVIDTIAQHSPNFKASDPACRNSHSLGHRERSRPHRGQYLPGRTDHGSAVVQPPDPGLRAIPRAGARACTCAAPAPIRAAASWARPARMRPAPCCAISVRAN